jgi:uncharacterized protein YabN with tetrapyrrole methylase and pyrophosphatase domain
MEDNTPLHKLIDLEKDARSYGFYWPNADCIIDQIISEAIEVKEAIQNQESEERVQEEIGDLLHAVISLCEFKGFDIDETLSKVNLKFDRRMANLKAEAEKHNLLDLKGQSYEFMLELWEASKNKEQ